MSEFVRHARLPGRLVMVGCGSIGQAVMPLLLRHLDLAPERMTIVTADARGAAVADSFGVAFTQTALTRENYRAVLGPLLGNGDFLLNLSVDVSSLSLVRLCAEKGALYLDTCIEPWSGGYTDLSLSPSRRSNYAFRETALALGNELAARPHGVGRGPTMVLGQGANPGLVSQLMKEAALQVARDTGLTTVAPTDRAAWARLFMQLGVKAIHIAERDTQTGGAPKKPGEFVNTWSIDGFLSEGVQPAECGWGTHEKSLPPLGATHDFGCGAAIYLNRPGAGTKVRSWTPGTGPYHGFMITHNEAISIADYLTVRDGERVVYRPTVHYAYHPCDAAVLSAHELAGRSFEPQTEKRLLMDDITAGRDELGVLLMGHAEGAYWYGSQLDIDEARRLAPHNSATTLQVAAGVLGGIVWAIENPDAGVVESDELDYARVIEVARPYLGPVVGVYTDWTPLHGRGQLFPEDVDNDDPWQFKNILVA